MQLPSPPVRVAEVHEVVLAAAAVLRRRLALQPAARYLTRRRWHGSRRALGGRRPPSSARVGATGVLGAGLPAGLGVVKSELYIPSSVLTILTN